MEWETRIIYLTFGLLHVTAFSVPVTMDTFSDLLSAYTKTSSANSTLTTITSPSTSSPTTHTPSTSTSTTATTTISTKPATTSTSTENLATSTTVAPVPSTNWSFTASSVCSNGNINKSHIIIASVCLSVVIIILLIVISVLLWMRKRNTPTMFAKNNSSLSTTNADEVPPDTASGRRGRPNQIRYAEHPSTELDIRPALNYSNLDTQSVVTEYVNGDSAYTEFDAGPPKRTVTVTTDNMKDIEGNTETIYMNLSSNNRDNVYESEIGLTTVDKLSVGNVYSN